MKKSSDKIWTVYSHTSPSGKVYIGISSDVKSRWATKGWHYRTYNSAFKAAIDKYGWDNIKHEVLLEGVTKAEADYSEKYLIRWYKLHDKSYNITDGGEGTLGRKDSPETIEKKRVANCGRKRTPEQIERLRKSHQTDKAKITSVENLKAAHNAWTGRHHTEETKKKMSEAAKGRDMSKAIAASLKVPRKHRTKPIVQLDMDNNIVAIFLSAVDAKKALNKTSNSISNCLAHKTQTALGYKWEYKV